MASNKRVFECDGKEYAILRPTTAQTEDASMEYNRIFSKSLKSGALLRESLEKFMREQELWDDDKENLYSELLTQINQKEKSLSKGGIKLSEAKDIALEMRGIRAALQGLIAQRNSLDVNTAQGQAENARFNTLLVSSLVYNDSGQRVYSDVEEYLEKQADGDELGTLGAQNFANMYFGLDQNYEVNLPENKFLKQWKFVDDSLHLVNEEGKLVDYDGKLVNQEGFFVDESGKPINFEGDPVSLEGNYNFETQPFLNEEGLPLGEDGVAVEKSDKPEKSTTAKSKPRGRPRKKAEASQSDTK